MLGLEVRHIDGKGRGVFAVAAYSARQVIEECQVLVIRARNPELKKMGLYDYVFQWQEGTRVAIATGFGSLYNHSYTPNAKYSATKDWEKLLFRALRDIAPGEEITVNYNSDPSCRDPLWFDVE